tara:strand:- start:10821 stop:10964 length:144 start_codon:yes stop_codon:yes gene_type:complete
MPTCIAGETAGFWGCQLVLQVRPPDSRDYRYLLNPDEISANNILSYT